MCDKPRAPLPTDPAEGGLAALFQPRIQTQYTHPQVISILSRLQQEWQEATDGTSLLESNGNIGLMPVDLIQGFRFNLDEQRQILGAELF